MGIANFLTTAAGAAVLTAIATVVTMLKVILPRMVRTRSERDTKVYQEKIAKLQNRNSKTQRKLAKLEGQKTKLLLQRAERERTATTRMRKSAIAQDCIDTLRKSVDSVNFTYYKSPELKDLKEHQGDTYDVLGKLVDVQGKSFNVIPKELGSNLSDAIAAYRQYALKVRDTDAPTNLHESDLERERHELSPVLQILTARFQSYLEELES